MKIVFLPPDFSELFRLQSKRSFDAYASTTREGNDLAIRLDLGDFTEDDILVAVCDSQLVILGSHYPASFCLHLSLPEEAVQSGITGRVSDGVLQLRLPLRVPTPQPQQAAA